jgi:hypothetical protein
LHEVGSAQATQEGGVLVGEAIFGTLLVILFGGMFLAVLFDISDSWENKEN